MFFSSCQITFFQENEYMLQVLSTTANPYSRYKLQFIVHFQGKREDVLRNFTESSSKTLHFSDDELSVQSDLLAPSSLECSVKLVPTSTLKFMINYYSSSQIFWHQFYFTFLKNPPANARDGLDSRVGKIGGGIGSPLQHACLGIPWTEKSGGLQSMASQESDLT